MEEEIRKVLRLRRVDKSERRKLFSMLQQRLLELEILIGNSENYRATLSEVNSYFQDEVKQAYFIEHEDEICGFALIEYRSVKAEPLIRINELFLTPLHRVEGFTQFILENVLSDAIRRRVPLVWEAPQADKEMVKLYERFCSWAVRHLGCKLDRHEIERYGQPYFRFILRV